MLTDIKCKTAKPKQKPYKLSDSFGLVLLVRKSGVKSWLFRYRFGGKEKNLTIGTYPEVSLLQARKERDDARELLRQNIDPSLDKKTNKLLANSEEDFFENVAENYFDSQKDRWVSTYYNYTKSEMRRYVYPDIGKVKLKNITPQMILSVLKKIEKNSPLIAHRCKQKISDVFRIGISLGYCTTEPASSLTRMLKVPKNKNYAAITNIDELKLMINKIETNFYCNAITLLGFRFLALTGLRNGEMRALEWIDFKEDEKIIYVPAHKMKMRRPHIVTLSRQAIDVLTVMNGLSFGSKYIFPSVRNPNKTMSECTLTKLLRENGYGGIHVPHGFRASFSSIMNEHQPENRDIIDLMLAHVSKSTVESAYNRSEHLEKRRKIAQDWADLLYGDDKPAIDLVERKTRVPD